MRRPVRCALLVAFIAAAAGCGERSPLARPPPRWIEGDVAVIPRPAQVEVDEGGGSLELPEALGVFAPAQAAPLLETLRERLFPRAVAASAGSAQLRLVVEGDGDPASYRLTVDPAGVSLVAPAAAGLFHGLQTLRQLLPAGLEAGDRSHRSVPFVRIADTPRFAWRGFMLDVSRTFVPMPYLLRQLELLALLKLDVLHLHLTDDQGWRMEIASHPELHEVGSKWDAALFPDEVGGYYTKAELRALVAAAAARHIRVVPEIDLPGHSLAMLRAMPELACEKVAGQPRARDEFRIIPWSEGPRIHAEVLCACDPRVYDVLRDVLTEVAEVFPDAYVHVGGDETPREEWAQSPLCRRLVADGTLAGIEEVQGYFGKRVAGLLASLDRRMIGWTEARTADGRARAEDRLGGALTTMHWLAYTAPPPDLYAYPVVLTPAWAYYLDYFNLTDLAGVYAYEPVPAALSAAERANVLGVQGNMWTGFPQGRSPERIDVHVYPKLAAIAEAAWTDPARKDRARFEASLAALSPRLALLGVAQGSCEGCLFRAR